MYNLNSVPPPLSHETFLNWLLVLGVLRKLQCKCIMISVDGNYYDIPIL